MPTLGVPTSPDAVDGIQDRTWFDRHGFVGPVNILDVAEAHKLGRKLAKAPAPSDWIKGCAATSAEFYRIATHPAILKHVQALLGQDVMLCGANVAVREPGQVHEWHSDAHAIATQGRGVTVWVGLTHTSRNSSLHLLPGSHQYGMTVQQQAHQEGLRYVDAKPDDVLTWSRRRDESAAILRTDMQDGDVLFVDDRLWHGSQNDTNQTRSALLLHYATPDKPIRIPTPRTGYEWPFGFLDTPRPPCLMVLGSDRHRVNRIVPPPTLVDGRSLSQIWDLQERFAQHSQQWKSGPMFDATTRCVARLILNDSTLMPNTTAHHLHSHESEELFIPYEGETRLLLGDESSPVDVGIVPGQIVFCPAGQRHTHQNREDAPTKFLTIKWQSGGDAPPSKIPLGTATYDYRERHVDPDLFIDRTWATDKIVEGPTQNLPRLRIHISEYEPGSVQEEHIDAYDIVLLPLSGTLETLGQRITPKHLVFYAAGEPHGLTNLSDETARCLTVEIHNQYMGKPHRSLRRAIVSRLPRSLRVAVRRLRERRKKR